MATREPGDPNTRSVLFEVAAYNHGWYTIAWTPARIWADDIAKAHHAATGHTTEVWQNDRCGDGWISTPVGHWEQTPVNKPETTTIVTR